MENTKERSKTLRRNIRDGLTDVFVSIARVLFFWVPGGDAAQGRALMAFHPVCLAVILALFFVAPTRSPLRVAVAILSIIVTTSQWLFSGCVVTRAEQRLTGSKETILDPFLTLAGLEANRDSRVAATLATGTMTCAILLWSVACDFYFGTSRIA